MLNQFLLQIIALLVSCSESNEGHNDLTLDFIGLADDCSFCYLGMRDKRGLNLSVGEPVVSGRALLIAEPGRKKSLQWMVKVNQENTKIQ